MVGGGTMGVGIAAAFLDAGIAVTLLERDQAALDRGLTAVAQNLRRRPSSAAECRRPIAMPGWRG